ncbi:hypothetical protein IT575_01830 [bacterium]|nr:hypothetical protein [bacterium]
MRAVYSRPGDVLRGWADSWSSRADNPLLSYWASQDLTARSMLPWYRRSPGLLLAALVLSCAVCAALLLTESIQQGSLPGSLDSLVRGERIMQLQISIFLLGLHLLALLWLASAFGAAAALALGFLEPQPRQVLRRSLDDLLAVSALTEQQLLLGLLLYSLRRLALPLLLVVGSGALLCYFGQDTFGISLASWELTQAETVAVGPLLLVGIGTLLSAFGGCLCLLLLFVSLSLSAGPSALPQSGAWLQAQTQLWLVPLALVSLAGLPFIREDELFGGLDVLLPLAFAAWLQIILGLYLARRWPWLRLLIGHSIAGPLLAVLVPLYATLLLSGELLAPANALAIAGFSVLFALSSYNPLPFLLLLGGEQSTAFRVLLCFAAIQLLSLPILAGLARDAIQRRKWEGR